MMIRIKKELEILNFDFSYIGTRYLLEVIYEIYINWNLEEWSLNSKIYPIISKKFKTSINTIKCNITYSLNKSLLKSSNVFLERYLKIYQGEKNPKIRDIIIVILNKIER